MSDPGMQEAPVAQAHASSAALGGDDASRPAGVGDRLRNAREEKGMSLADVSQAIKINPRVLEQIEGNAWGELSGHTFARGVVRSYARLLHLDAEALLRELEHAPLPKPPLLELPRSTQAAIPVPGETQKRDRYAMVVGVAMVALAIVAYFLVPDDWRGISGKGAGSAPVSPPAVVASNLSPAVPPAPIGVAPAEPALLPPASVAMAPPVSVPAVVDSPAPQAAVSLAAHHQGLALSFVQESWAEVRDRSGTILISENVAAGGERRLAGEPPYNIWLGNAEGVRMTFRGAAVDLAPHTRQKVARLILE